MKNKTLFKYIEIALCVALIFIINDVSAQTQQKLQGAYNWLKPLIHIVLLVVTVIAAARAISKTFFKHQEAGMEWVMFVVACALWGLWTTFASEIIQLLGGGTVIF